MISVWKLPSAFDFGVTCVVKRDLAVPLVGPTEVESRSTTSN